VIPLTGEIVLHECFLSATLNQQRIRGRKKEEKRKDRNESAREKERKRSEEGRKKEMRKKEKKATK
jgi:hypothetical protein